MHILIVDDHAVVRQGYASLLTALLPEVVVTEAESGELALQRVQDEIPSLVVLDLGLPGISGLETCRRLRQRLPLLPVLIFMAPILRGALPRIVDRCHGRCRANEGESRDQGQMTFSDSFPAAASVGNSASFG